MNRALALAACVTVMGCGAVGFDVEQKLPEQRVSGSAFGGLLPSFVPQQRLSVDLKQETAKRNTGPATAAYLKSLTFTVTNASGNFDFLESAVVSIAAPSASLPKQNIAVIQDVVKGSTTVKFAVDPSVNLLPFINAGAEVSAGGEGSQPTKDVTFDGLLVIDVRL